MDAWVHCGPSDTQGSGSMHLHMIERESCSQILYCTTQAFLGHKCMNVFEGHRPVQIKYAAQITTLEINVCLIHFDDRFSTRWRHREKNKAAPWGFIQRAGSALSCPERINTPSGGWKGRGGKTLYFSFISRRYCRKTTALSMKI